MAYGGVQGSQGQSRLAVLTGVGSTPLGLPRLLPFHPVMPSVPSAALGHSKKALARGSTLALDFPVSQAVSQPMPVLYESPGLWHPPTATQDGPRHRVRELDQDAG